MTFSCSVRLNSQGPKFHQKLTIIVLKLVIGTVMMKVPKIRHLVFARGTMYFKKFLFIYLLVVLGFELRALCSTTLAMPLVLVALVILEIGSCFFPRLA
jgi:hypothetical protein